MQEATQSHQVKKSNSQILLSNIKTDRSTVVHDNKHSDEPNVRKMCLLLVEDVDIVYEQDDGFISALSQLLTTSKRPVVLVTADESAHHLQRFLNQYHVIRFSLLSDKILPAWLQTVCLLEGSHVDKQSLVELYRHNKCDVRKTLLQLQFWVSTGGEQRCTGKTVMQYLDDEVVREEQAEVVCEDDNSNLSWLDDEQSTEVEVLKHTNCVKSFVVFEDVNNFSVPYCTDLSNLWWNLPKILNFKTNTYLNNEKTKEVTVHSCDENSKHKMYKKLKSASDLLESIAFADVLSCTEMPQSENDLPSRSRTFRVGDSLELNENFQDYLGTTDFVNEITHHYLKGSLNTYKAVESTCIDVGLPSMEQKRLVKHKQYFELVTVFIRI